MVVPVLPHEVKTSWDYFTFSRTQLPVLCVYVEGAICRVNDLEQWCPTFFVSRSTFQAVNIPRSTSPVSTTQTYTHLIQPA